MAHANRISRQLSADKRYVPRFGGVSPARGRGTRRTGCRRHGKTGLVRHDRARRGIGPTFFLHCGDRGTLRPYRSVASG